jgi:DNA modification methylase
MKATLLHGDCLDVLPTLPANSVDCCVTSPPYWGLRDYGCAGQLGIEKTPEEYVANMVAVFREVKRVLRDDGTLWLNLGDSYAASRSYHVPDGKNKACDEHHKGSHKVPPGLKPKDIVGIPWRVAFALQADGWFLRQDIIWHKPNPMPESVTDRCTKSHEYIFLLSKSAKYYYDAEAILEPASPGTHARLAQDVQNQIGSERANGGTRSGRPMKAVKREGPCSGMHVSHANPDSKPNPSRSALRKLAPNGSGTKNNASFDDAMAIMPIKRNKRSVWTVATESYRGAHFATFPRALIQPCILAGCPSGGTVLDPFGGSGTTGQVAESLGRNSILIELNPSYIELQKKRTAQMGLAV